MHKKLSVAVASALLLSTPLAAPAAAVDYLTPYVGYFDIVRGNHDATQFGLEYSLSPVFHGVRPLVGGNLTTDGSSYVYAGFNWDVPLIDNQLYLVPSFTAGAYSDGDGKDLGGTIEFRSGIGMDYQFSNAHRIGVVFNHISNASIYDHNPGSETLLINYSIPVGNVMSNF